MCHLYQKRAASLSGRPSLLLRYTCCWTGLVSYACVLQPGVCNHCSKVVAFVWETPDSAGDEKTLFVFPRLLDFFSFLAYGFSWRLYVWRLCTADGSGPMAILMQCWRSLCADCGVRACVFSLSFAWNAHKHGCYFSSRAVAAVTSSCLSQHVPAPWELPTYTIWTSNVGLSWTVSVWYLLTLCNMQCILSHAHLLFCFSYNVFLLHFTLTHTISNFKLLSFFLTWRDIKLI